MIGVKIIEDKVLDILRRSSSDNTSFISLLTQINDIEQKKASSTTESNKHREDKKG